MNGEYFIAIVVAYFTGAWLHEGSHYLVGWIGQTGPRMEYYAKVIPNTVRHSEIETMDSELIRMSGISIFTWIPVGLLALALFLLNPTPVNSFLAGTPVVILVMATESDAIAARNPEKFREMAIANEFDRKLLFCPDITKLVS